MTEHHASRNNGEIIPKLDGAVLIGGHEFDPNSLLLNRDGQQVQLRAKSAEVLRELARNGNALVTKDALIDAVWGNTHVTEDSLVQCIGDVRRALGADAGLLETFPKRGYMLRVAEPAIQAGRRWRYAAILAMTMILGAVWMVAGNGPEKAAAFGGRTSVAVLPFRDFSTGADSGYLGDAISEGILADLSGFDEIAVISANSSRRYRGGDIDLTAIGEELGADYLLTGSQTKRGDRLKLTVRIVNGKDGSQTWTATYMRDIGDLFALEAELVRAVAGAVGYRMAYETPPPTGRERVDALHYHRLGRNVLQTGFDGDINERFRQYNLKAIEADPKAPYGYSGLAFYYRNEAQFGWSGLGREEALAKGEVFADKGIELGPEDYYAHFVRAAVHVVAGEMEQAMLRFDKAVELNSSASNVLVMSTEPLLYSGRTNKAIQRLKAAMEIDPFHPDWYHWQIAWAHWQNEDCGKALSAFRRMAEVPSAAQAMLAAVYVCLGEESRAREALAAYIRDRRGFSLATERAKYEKTWTAPGELERYLAALATAGAT